MAGIQLLASVGGGAYSHGAQQAAFGQTVNLQTQVPSGITLSTILYEVYDYPPGMALPSGWSLASSGVWFFDPSNVTTAPPTITLPSSGANNWGPLMLRVRGNSNPLRLNANGSLNQSYQSTLTDEATIVWTASPKAGMQGVGYNETTQRDAQRSWAGPYMQSLRALDAGVGLSSTGLAVSMVDWATGFGAAGLGKTQATSTLAYTMGVGFGATQPGHFCLGARVYWGNTASSGLKISLWNQSGTRLATTSIAAPSSAAAFALFGSPVALVPGIKYAVTVFDLSPGPGPPTPWSWFYNGASSGTAHLGDFVPSNAGNSTQWGPFIVGCDFVGGGQNGIYGLLATPFGDAVPNSGSIQYCPIEPVVS